MHKTLRRCSFGCRGDILDVDMTSLFFLGDRLAQNLEIFHFRPMKPKFCRGGVF